MNNKDREALDKFVDEDTLSPEDTKRFAEMSDGERATFIAERFFEAGAKHGRADMQNAYETLNAHDEMLISIVDKLKDEIDKLRQALKFTTKAAVHLFKPDKPLEKGLAPFFYHTTTYDGDLELIENTKLAMELIKENK